ncbi:MAG: SDR family oxidoreductase [Candidatus Zixiibacteriota bacterium]
MLKNRTVFVTGASSGIGLATARKFAEAGARVLMAARRIDRLEKLASLFQTETHLLKLDVRNKAAVEKEISGLPSAWQEIDILINNAGLSRGLDKLHQGDTADWDEMIDTNVKGLLYVSRAVIPGMVKRGRGQIVNIGSIAGHELYPGGNVYCATKHAVNALTRGLLMDLVDTPVRVCSVDPGLVQTEFSEVRFHGDTERAAGVYQGYKPLSGDDIAESILWVCSRPEHVQVAELIILPKAQASAMVVHKQV